MVPTLLKCPFGGVTVNDAVRVRYSGKQSSGLSKIKETELWQLVQPSCILPMVTLWVVILSANTALIINTLEMLNRDDLCVDASFNQRF